MTLYTELFDDEEPVEFKQVSTVPDLDFYWLEGATKLADRQAADRDIRQVAFTELMADLVGEIPISEPKIQKTYASPLIKAIFGGVVPVVVGGPSPAVSVTTPESKKKIAAERKKYLRDLIRDSGISVNDANQQTIEALISSMEHFVDGNIKAART
jgi:hypothetical protein